MAVTLFTNRNAEPPASQDQVSSMPHVFVVPPEEDDSPTWCCFDAANPRLSQVIEQPETPQSQTFGFIPDMDSPVLRRNYRDPVSMPQRSIETRSVVDALMRDDFDGDDDFDSDTEDEHHGGHDVDPHSIQESPRSRSSRRLRDAANDPDVVEVIKVRRNRSSPYDPDDVKRSLPLESRNGHSNTIKSRASKAFRSLKGTLRSKHRAQVQDLFASGSSKSTLPDKAEGNQQEETLRRARSPYLSRRGSGMLSQLFRAPPLKSRTSVASFDEPPSPTSPIHIPSYSSSSINSNFVAASASSQEPLSRRPSLYEASEQEQARFQATSPTPTTTATKSGTRRFAILSLQNLFSFASPKPHPVTEPLDPAPTFDDSDRATPTLRSTPSSLISASVPQTPTSSDDIIPPVRPVNKDDAATTDPLVFDSLDSMLDINDGLKLGLGLGLRLDSVGSTVVSAPEVEKTPRKSSSSWTSSITPKMPSRFRANPFSPPPRVLEPDDEDGDDDLEMRLDSFHFDDLSFDADRFEVN